MSEILLEVHEREATGKNHNRRLRATGQVPAVVYGGGLGAAPIRVQERKVADILLESGGNTVFLLKLHGADKQRHAMIRELQTDALTGEMIHIDFQRIMMDQQVKVMVPIELTGEAEGVKTEGGLIDFVTREIEVACLPSQIPQSIGYDVTPLHIGQHVEADDLDLPEGVELVTDTERVIVSVAMRMAVEEEVVEEEDELLEAAAEEPEVIQRGKAEDEAKE